MTTIAAAGAMLARATAVAQAIGLDAMPLVERAARGDLAVQTMCRIGLDGAGDRLRVMAPVQPEAPDVDAELAGLVGRAADLAVELSIDRAGTIAAATIAFGRWNRDDALGILTALAHLDDAAGIALGERLDLLAGPGVRPIAIARRGGDCEILLAMPTPDPATAARLDRFVEPFPNAQRGLLADLGKLLGERSRPALIATVPAIARTLGVTWRATPMKLILKFLVGLGLGDGKTVGERIGALAGAFGVDHATAFELVLGARDPDARVDIDLVAGRVA